MNFANPNYFPSIFAAVLVLAAFYAWAMRRRRRLLEAFAEKDLIGGIASSASPWRRVAKLLMVAASVILVLTALARPRWGFEWQEVNRSGIDILIAIDVSKSMLATDVKPNRLERSKFAVRDLVKKLNGDRIGLVAFAGTAFLQCPLTIDYNGFLLALDDLFVGTIPRGGTSLSSAVKEAISVFSSGGGKGVDKKHRVLVIITDGEDFEGDALAAVREASANGIKIYCVGVGTEGGELIPVYGARGQKEYLADKSGNVVKTKLNEDMLKRIAIATGGSYVRATQAEFGLVLLYDQSISKLEKRELESKMRKHYVERFQIFLLLAAMLLFVEPLISDRRRTGK